MYVVPNSIAPKQADNSLRSAGVRFGAGAAWWDIERVSSSCDTYRSEGGGGGDKVARTHRFDGRHIAQNATHSVHVITAGPALGAECHLAVSLVSILKTWGAHTCCIWAVVGAAESIHNLDPLANSHYTMEGGEFAAALWAPFLKKHVHMGTCLNQRVTDNWVNRRPVLDSKALLLYVVGIMFHFRDFSANYEFICALRRITRCFY
ncbi:hypothetical protein C8R44DRAFT_739955 [Mycena epipterygia]|nr:hypothetical protein C8R44DRAFT_739955 [Mycena epipterygia]